MDQVLDHIKSGQTIMFSDVHGQQGADEIIDAMLKTDVKDITVIAIASGNPKEGVGKLIVDDRVKKVVTSHTGLNPVATKKMIEGKLEVEYCPQGNWIERIHAGGAGLGGVITPTGVGTEVEEGKEKLNIDGKDYIIEKPLKADVAIIKAGVADKAGNIKFKGDSLVGNDEMALAAKFPIFEVDELVEIGELGYDEIDVIAPVTGLVYVKEKEREIPLAWKRISEKESGGK
ncbi:CoA transferase subunit A [uncultured Anaerococcus sp.]|uniref:CoA transferase subunit A n=1 Tax=uncultured Anaerococcus sp. TaxID=293428 RepID=UPI002632AD02|nr:3-oxoacid CoA-transferase subunit A [uncultured Anaerococcus sp.]